MKRAAFAYTPLAIAEIALGFTGNMLYDQYKELHSTAFWMAFGTAQVFALFFAVYVTIIIERARFRERCELFHSFVHRLRDLSVMAMPQDSPPRKVATHQDLLSPELGYKLTKTLDSMAEMFSRLAPLNSNVFTAIRERRADGSFQTLRYRGGKSKVDRQEKSMPLQPSAAMIKRLVDSYNDGQDCVIITGQQCAEWIDMPNNRLKEDMSVLMGAVFRKVWLPGGADNEFPHEERHLEWILCVAADRPDAFKDWHKPLMKCYNDAFGILLNELVRSQRPQSEVGKKTGPMVSVNKVVKK